MEPHFEQFIRERQYLTNVTPATIEWYRRCFKWLPSECPTQADLTACRNARNTGFD
jgi:integrase/recombinase XerD